MRPGGVHAGKRVPAPRHLDGLSLNRALIVVPLRFDADAVVHRSANSLLAAEITLRRLDGDMAQQELDLLQLSSRFATQAGAGPT